MNTYEIQSMVQSEIRKMSIKSYSAKPRYLRTSCSIRSNNKGQLILLVTIIPNNFRNKLAKEKLCHSTVTDENLLTE